ncbi:uncharacterized protein LOC108820409 [Raphanus sativus]|uniref:Uncharacterized protein LOC108820409 n=1 Tax=Raphanus sativus TaxID=3726 RepID=A0A6J0KPA0_RAPSA|nr:uncharacterized protein LOC108820409 [Raphanus sativus]
MEDLHDFWSDNWSPYGNIADFLHLPSNGRLGISRSATISDLYSNGAWNLPADRSEEQVLLHIYMSSITLNQEEDQYDWVINNNSYIAYSTGTVYAALKHHNPIVTWADTVWLSKDIPKHSFLTWLFVLNRCSTRDRLLNWGVLTDPMCLLCNLAPETRDHLFFACDYSRRIWTSIATRCGITPSPSWDQNLLDMQSTLKPRHIRYLGTLSWQCSMYLIWTERNNRLHRQVFRPPDSIISSIEATIRAKISAIRHTSSRLAFSVFSAWNA